MEAFIASGMMTSQGFFFPLQTGQPAGDKWDVNIGLCRSPPRAAETMPAGSAVMQLCSLSP